MKKSALFGVLILAGLSAAASAQTLSYVKSIDVGATAGGGAAPVGLDFYNGDVFATAFNDKKVVKVASPLSATPTVSTIADLSSAYTWPAARGTSGIYINQANGNIYVTGDTGTVGAIAVYNQAGTQLSKTDYAQRVGAGILWGSTPGFLVTRPISASMELLTDPAAGTPTSTAVGPATVAPNNNSHRDLVAVGNDIYYSRNAASTSNSVAKLSGGTAGAWSGYNTGSTVYTSTGTATIAFEGLTSYNYTAGSKTYIIYVDSAAAKVIFIDTADNSVDVVLQDSHLTTGIRDAVVGRINNVDYLFVCRASGTPTNAIDVFSIDAPQSAVNDWSVY